MSEETENLDAKDRKQSYLEEIAVLIEKEIQDLSIVKDPRTMKLKNI